LAGPTAWIENGSGVLAAAMPLRPTAMRHRRWKRTSKPAALSSQLECLERRELLTFGSLVQAGLTKTPFTNTSDVSGQSGTVYLNGEVEPSVAVDPSNPQHLVAIWQQDRWSNGGSRGLVVGVSTDGGNTWTDSPMPGASVNSGGTDLRSSNAWVSFGPDGKVYASWLGVPDPNVANPSGVYISASSDGGYTWSTPTAAITNNGDPNLFDDKDTITADPYTAGEAYVVWDRLDFSDNTGPAMFSRTTDGGQTWSTPVQIFNPANGQTISNQVVVLPGDVVVDMAEYIDYGSGATSIVVMRSTDQGATWSSPITVSNINFDGITDPNTGAGVRAGEYIPMIATDPTDGNIYIVWQDNRFSGGAHDDIAFSESTDGGFTWSTPIKANQTPQDLPTGDEQAFDATVAVAADGIVAVSYYDFRNNTGTGGLLTDRWIAFANPAEPNFTFGNEQRLTDSSFDLELAPNAYGEFLGDYETLVAGGESTNTFSSLFTETVSTDTPGVIYFRGTIPPNTLSLTSFSPPAGAVQWQPTGGTLATFSDDSPEPNINTYTAVVTWGDGTTDALTAANGGIVSNGGGSFSVVDSHTYAEDSAGESFGLQITDDGGGTAGSSATVAVADAIHAPSSATVNENSSVAFTAGNAISFVDPNAGSSKAESLTLSVSHGTLTLGSTTGLTFKAGKNKSTSFTVTGTVANLNSALSGLIDTPTAAYWGADSLAISVNDPGDGESAAAFVSLIVNPLSPPAITAPTAASVGENLSLSFSTANGNAISVADTNAGAKTDTLTLSVTNGTLTLGATSGLTFKSGKNGTSAFSIAGTLANLNSALNGLTYLPTSRYAGSDALEASIVNSGDGQSVAANVALTVTAATSPAITAPQTASLNENGSQIFSAANGNAISVTDSNSGTSKTESLALSVTNGMVKLATTAGLQVTSGANNSSSLTVTGTVANLNVALNGLTYKSKTGYSGSDSLAITVNDPGDGLSANAAVALMVNVAPPVLTAPSSSSVAENGSLVFSTNNPISVSDINASSGIEQMTLSATSGKLKLGSTSGITFVSGTNNSALMTITGTLAHLNSALKNLTFTPQAGYQGAATISLNYTDEGNSLTASATIPVTVNSNTPAVEGDTNLATPLATTSDDDALDTQTQWSGFMDPMQSL